MKIVVVTDGGVKMGMGHIHQAITLCQSLRRGADVRFLTKSDPLVVRTISNAGFSVDAVADDAQVYASLQTEDPDVVLFDKIDVGVNLARLIRHSMRARLVIFTNLTAANDYAHMVVLPRAADVSVDVSRRFQNHAYRDLTTGTVYFYGPTYWVLRPEFHQFRALEKSAGAVRRILLTFGGSDPTDLTLLVLNELLRAEEPYFIDVILGSHYSRFDALDELVRLRGPNATSLTLHRNVSNVGALMHKADLAITAAGMSMFEALRVRTPVIVIPQDENQRATYDGVVRLLLTEQVGELKGLIEARDFTNPGDPFIENMRIGEGIESLVDSILQLAAGTGSGTGTGTATEAVVLGAPSSPRSSA